MKSSGRPRLGVFTALVVAIVVAVMVASARQSRPTVILISIDALGAAMYAPDQMPTLARLAREGVRAESMRPIFPTKTFPNHYTMVTGLYAEHHGLVANNMWDPAMEDTYALGKREAVRDRRWYGGEPIWVTAETQDQRTAPLFWPGSEADITGVSPSHRMPYAGDLPNASRVDSVLAWLDLPEADRPTFLTLYFEDVDEAAHDYGLAARETHRAMQQVDSALARLVAGLEQRGILEAVNLIVVSDHGMAETSPERVLLLDERIDLERVHVSDWDPVAAIWPDSAYAEAALRRLRADTNHWTVWRKAEIPDRMHYRAHPRIAPLIVLADEGWSITSRDFFRRRRERFAGASHGYDNRLPSMQATFIARGPAFKRDTVVEPLQNIHLYELICAILGLTPAPNDGSLDSVRGMLR